MSVEQSIILIILVVIAYFLYCICYHLNRIASTLEVFSLDIKLVMPDQPRATIPIDEGRPEAATSTKKKREVPLPDPAILLKKQPKASGFGSQNSDEETQ